MKLKGKIAALLAASLLLCGSALAADFSNLVIMHTNDTHGWDRRAEGINGMATVAAMKKDFESKGKDVLLVDAGDAIQDNNLANFSKGAAVMRIMNAAGYEAMEIGNHEFDYGQAELQKRAKEAKFPFLASNVIVDATGKTLFAPYVIKQKGPVKIGVIGILTADTPGATMPENVKGLTFLDDIAVMTNTQRLVDFLRWKEKVDLVVVLGHMGSQDKSTGHRADDVLRYVEGIDIWIDGHDHLEKNHMDGKTLVAETGCFTHNIGVIRYEDNKWTETLSKYGDFNEEDPKVKAIIDEEQAKVDAVMAKEIARTPFEMNGERAPGVRTEETNLGDLVTDAFLWQARQKMGHVDAAIANGGGIRRTISAGAITLGDAAGVLPYRNHLVVVTVKGSVLLEILEASTAFAPDPVGAFPQVAGIRYTVNTTVPYEKGTAYKNGTYSAPAKPGARVTIHEVAGKPFNPAADYTLCVTNFLITGGDSYSAFTDPEKAKNIRSVGVVDCDAFVNYLSKELKGRVPDTYRATQGRITILK